MDSVPGSSRWILSRRFTWTLLWSTLAIVGAIIANLIGIHVIGSTSEWSQWLHDHHWHFFLWRLCVYGATAYGWWRMRRRILSCELHADDANRLARAELAIVLAIITLEIALLFQS